MQSHHFQYVKPTVRPHKEECFAASLSSKKKTIKHPLSNIMAYLQSAMVLQQPQELLRTENQKLICDNSISKVQLSSQFLNSLLWPSLPWLVYD